ncbi:MAG: hypothetical protein K9N07_09455 [Candidatus Cloacimonetes bacterium]|nr:hypothetical protein [Candidatus Cloacimonadota bacterium]
MNKKNFKTELRFTEVYQQFLNSHTAIREANCLKAQYPDYFSEIRDNDLFAGRINHGLVGFSIDEWGSTAFGYYCRFEEIEKTLNEFDYAQEEEKEIRTMMKFWEKEDTSKKLRSAYPDEMKKWLPSDDWMNSSGIAFPLYRLTGGNIDNDKLLQLGIPGLKRELESKLKTADSERKGFYEGALIALDVLIDVAKHYAAQAKYFAEEAQGKSRKTELRKISDTLEMITVSKPKTLREAIQLFWLYSLISDIRNHGRMDVYLGDFLANDLHTGTQTKLEALQLLQSLWQLMADRDTVVHGRIIVGGKGRRNETNADEFALLAMEATRTVHEIEPQLSLRIYKGMDERLYEKALDVISEGRTYPIIYNDDVNIPSVISAFEFSPIEAEQYVPYGCGEYILEHQSFGTPSGVINLLKALEVTLHNGVDPITREISGLQFGQFEDFNTFDELLIAYKKQVEFFVDLMAQQEELEYRIAGESAPFLFASILYDNCIEKGAGLFQGGIRYLGGTLETYGNTNTADSLIAIKKIIYESNKITKEELLNALDNNFEENEDLRKELLNQPKYGNDNDEADSMLVQVHEHVCNYVRDQKNKTNLHSYLVVIINNSANTLMGHTTSASADGRLSGTFMNNGNAPAGGMDKEGVTAMLNSIVKPRNSIHAGGVQNMKFSRKMFTENRAELKALLKTYFEKGGQQAMITVVNKNDLENAMKEPEKYHNLFVRVGGFSARFVELSEDVQKDILSRTLY